MKIVLFLSRFDLIFLMLDPQDEAYDRRLAKHLVSLYHQTMEEEEEESLVNSSSLDLHRLLEEMSIGRTNLCCVLYRT